MVRGKKPSSRSVGVLARWGFAAAVAVGTVACSSESPPEETPAYRDGREMGVALYEEGKWPDASQSKAEGLCRFPAQVEGLQGAEADDYIAGCAAGLREH
ncbi:hypothetical protein GCM10017562_01300 [Streptomyces roseofulvus]